LLNVIAQPRESGLRQIDRKHSELRIAVFAGRRLAESIGEEDRLPIAQERFRRDARSERLAVTIVIPPADLYIFRVGKVGARGPVAVRDI
jgi:hypothetical protein